MILPIHSTHPMLHSGSNYNRRDQAPSSSSAQRNNYRDRDDDSYDGDRRNNNNSTSQSQVSSVYCSYISMHNMHILLRYPVLLHTLLHPLFTTHSPNGPAPLAVATCTTRTPTTALPPTPPAPTAGTVEKEVVVAMEGATGPTPPRW